MKRATYQALVALCLAVIPLLGYAVFIRGRESKVTSTSIEVIDGPIAPIDHDAAKVHQSVEAHPQRIAKQGDTHAALPLPQSIQSLRAALDVEPRDAGRAGQMERDAQVLLATVPYLDRGRPTLVRCATSRCVINGQLQQRLTPTNADTALHALRDSSIMTKNGPLPVEALVAREDPGSHAIVIEAFFRQPDLPPRNSAGPASLPFAGDVGSQSSAKPVFINR